MKRPFIPVSAPVLNGNERKYVLDCLDTTWISSNGKYIEQFEKSFAEFCQTKHALSCCNGTVALHLALMALGLSPGDEVLVPTLTFVATANAVTYCGARPVFLDSDPDTWNLDVSTIASKITPRTKGIVAVHLYGNPVDMDALMSLAKKHGLWVVEDAAEAHGAEYRGKKVGSYGALSSFSFYGNKIITSGEGGMVVTNDSTLALKVSRLKGQGMDPDHRYWFPIIGYNYRMTNIAAALGLAQLENVDISIQRRNEIAQWYQEELSEVAGLEFQKAQENSKPVNWMFTILLNESLQFSRDSLMKYLLNHNIETRPVFYPMHILPPYKSSNNVSKFPIADRIASRGINLPTWGGLTRDDIQYICQTVRTGLKETKD
jgi:perosamine synthetase